MKTYKVITTVVQHESIQSTTVNKTNRFGHIDELSGGSQWCNRDRKTLLLGLAVVDNPLPELNSTRNLIVYFIFQNCMLFLRDYFVSNPYCTFCKSRFSNRI